MVAPIRETLTDEQLKAGKWLTRCYGALGKDGSTLIHEMLVSNRTTRQIARGSGHDRARLATLLRETAVRMPRYASYRIWVR